MSNLFLIEPKQIIDLYEISLGDHQGYFRFHGSKNFNKDIIFKGNSYLYIPSEISNLQYDSQGKQNRPTLVMSNVNNFISQILIDRNDLLGRRVYKKKLLAKDLDSVNFGGDSKKNPLGNSFFRDFIVVDTYVIHKKNYETKDKIEFELANVLDVDGMTCPKRKVYNDSCQWQYRGAGCNYGKLANYDGPVVTKKTNKFNTLQSVMDEFSSDNLKNDLMLWLKDLDLTGEKGDVRYFESKDKKYDSSAIGSRTVKSRNLALTRVSEWRNSANELNTDNSGIIIPDSSITLQGQPCIYNFDGLSTMSYEYSTKTSGGNQANRRYVTKTLKVPSVVNLKTEGMYFHVTKRNNGSVNRADGLKIDKDNFSDGDVTIFYVGCYAEILGQSNSNFGSILTSSEALSSSRYYFGYRHQNSDSNTYVDYYYAENQQIHSGGSMRSYNYKNRGKIHSISMEKSTGNVKCHQNGVLLKSNLNLDLDSNYTREGVLAGSLTAFEDLVINDPPSQGSSSDVGRDASQCIINEIIVFKAALTEAQIQAIHSYLAAKHGVPNVSLSLFEDKIFVKGKSFFEGTGEGNLGIPIADENDKTFLKTENSDSINNNSYDIKDLVYKGDYNSEAIYRKGDFVKIDPHIDFDFESEYNKNKEVIPSRFFVCVADISVKGVSPLSTSNIWKEDKCSKRLSGCTLRFRDEEKTLNADVPFGGFPGTVTYEYKLPNS